MTRTYVTLQNWKSQPEFIEWLSLEFSLHNCDAAVQHRILDLLPASIGEDRLTGAIKNIVLEAAIDRWNEPAAAHWFEVVANGYRYLGCGANIVIPSWMTAFCEHGRLVRPLVPGAFCRAPNHEVQ